MKKTLMTLAAFLVATTLLAAPVTHEAARQKAAAFVKKMKGGTTSRRLSPAKISAAAATDGAPFYVFNIGQQEGFVIVSGDDRTDEIIGYADEGSVNLESMPDNMRAFLQGYADELNWLRRQGDSYQAPRHIAKAGNTKKAISPLLTTKWNQDYPYNLYCSTSSGESAPTGCVATAIGQVMYYQSKKHNLGETAFMTNGSTVYYWKDVVDEYPSNIDKANHAVGLLMYKIGQGVNMQYGVQESSASSSAVPAMLIRDFNYDKDVHLESRNNYGYADWLDMMYAELTTNGPIFYGGQSTGGGHAFVLDGYSEDDFFHINWGWGGQSNGYFKLSVCYPSEQGIGGSSSQDGYNFSQDAVVGMKAVDDGNDETIPASTVRLTVEGVSCTEATTTRTSSDAEFSINVDNRIYNRTDATHSFDHAWALYQGDEQMATFQYYASAELYINYGFSSAPQTISFGKGLTAGVYRLVPISRETNTETWYPDAGSEHYHIQAIIDGNTLSIGVVGNANLSAVLSLLDSSSSEVGRAVAIDATVKNNDGMAYSGDLVLGTITENNTFKSLSAQQVELDAGAEAAFAFSFVPDWAGSYSLALRDKNNTVIGSYTLSISEASSSVSNLSFSAATELTEQDSNNRKINYGTSLQAKLKIKNEAAATDNSTVRVSLIQWKWSQSGRYGTATGQAVQSKSISLNLPAGTTYEEVLTYSGLSTDNTISYSARCTYSNNKEQDVLEFYCDPGITYYLADGTSKGTKLESTFATPDGALAIDLSEVNVTSVTPNSNPNTLYFVGNSIPDGLTGKNVVQDGKAEQLTLADGYDFYTPSSFTAAKASYTRQFTQGMAWSTITLPFDVSNVKAGENEIDWFHSDGDTGKNFWLKEFANESNGVADFAHAASMEANTPYIIAVPDDKWGADWDLTGKDITFEGEDASIAADAIATITGDNYKFGGTTRTKTEAKAYVFSGDYGQDFKLTEDAQVNAFRAYFLAKNADSANHSKVQIGSYIPTHIMLPEPEGHPATDAPACNMAGQRVSSAYKGIVIIGGKKVLRR